MNQFILDFCTAAKSLFHYTMLKSIVNLICDLLLLRMMKYFEL